MNAPVHLLDESGIAALVRELRQRRDAAGTSRLLIGLAGVAGSGKSTLAERLADEVGDAVVVGLDGFHLPNEVLRRDGLWERKGAPETYHARAFVDTLRRFRDRGYEGHYPVYDRAVRHEPVPSPEPITSRVGLILAEGQFMLLRD